jgi:protoheme IX farnesyltransferase
MLPVVAGRAVTRVQIFGYSVLLAVVAMAPFAFGLLGWVYGVAAALLNAVFVAMAIRVWRNRGESSAAMAPEKRLFAYSILYLFMLFGVVVADRLVLA